MLVLAMEFSRIGVDEDGRWARPCRNDKR
jgi:hypothetical protein